MQYLEMVMKAILDSLEECIDTMTIASGKRLLHVFYVTLGFLTFSILCILLKIPTFISWIEALVACIIVGLINCIDYMNKASINKVKEGFLMKIKFQKE